MNTLLKRCQCYWRLAKIPADGLDEVLYSLEEIIETYSKEFDDTPCWPVPEPIGKPIKIVGSYIRPIFTIPPDDFDEN